MAQQIPSLAGGILILEDGTKIEIAKNTERWQQWLENAQSFRYVPDSQESSYTVRKEKSKRGEGDYWYAYRKVQGKLHKRYIGKSSDLTIARLEEIANLLNVPTEPREKVEVTDNRSVTQDEGVERLQKEVERLQTEKQQLQIELQNRLKELEQLQSELHNNKKDLEVAVKKPKA